MNGSDVPVLIVLLAGVTMILESVVRGATGGVTVRTVVPETEPICALIVVVPAATPVARPDVEMVAVAVLVLDHVGATQASLEPSE